MEYSAHVIPEASRTGLFTDGLLVVGDAAGLIVNSGITLRGMDMAIASGMAAAEAVKIAIGKNDFFKKTLSHYEYLLKNDFVLGQTCVPSKDHRSFCKIQGFTRFIP